MGLLAFSCSGVKASPEHLLHVRTTIITAITAGHIIGLLEPEGASCFYSGKLCLMPLSPSAAGGSVACEG